MPLRPHWSDKYRTQRKSALRLCKECHAPNKPARRACWRCGSTALSTRGYQSELWQELWNRDARARELGDWSTVAFEKRVGGKAADARKMTYHQAEMLT